MMALVTGLALVVPPAAAQLVPAPTPVETPVPAVAAEPTAEQQPVPVVAPVPAQDPNDVVITGRSTRGDPAQAVNLKVFEGTQAIDRAVVGPMAKAYKTKIPSPVRDGLRNFLGNLREPVVAFNYLLQFKPGKAAETLGRFAINSTIGVAGLIDVAERKPFRLRKRRNSFANTLGYHGVKPGPFFFLPLVGGTSLRDLVGVIFDQAVVPVGPVRPFRGDIYTVPLGLVSALDYRAEFDTDLERIRSGPDPYTALREFYLARRQAEIDGLRGPRKVKPPRVVPTIAEPSAAGAPTALSPAGTAIVARFD
ncbi:MAG TPA: VacJ family lipoprotein, partial [Sphingomonas sp.]